jgi:hypothetical protein
MRVVSAQHQAHQHLTHRNLCGLAPNCTHRSPGTQSQATREKGSGDEGGARANPSAPTPYTLQCTPPLPTERTARPGLQSQATREKEQGMRVAYAQTQNPRRVYATSPMITYLDNRHKTISAKLRSFRGASL